VLQETHDREEIIERVAALDIGKAELVCCVRVPDEGRPGRRLHATRGYLPGGDLPEPPDVGCADEKLNTIGHPNGCGFYVAARFSSASSGAPMSAALPRLLQAKLSLFFT
jgi:hypothetical protein